MLNISWYSVYGGLSPFLGLHTKSLDNQSRVEEGVKRGGGERLEEWKLQITLQSKKKNQIKYLLRTERRPFILAHLFSTAIAL